MPGLQLTDRETAQILAALRYCQAANIFFHNDDHFLGEGLKPMTDDEVDALAEKINFGG